MSIVEQITAVALLVDFFLGVSCGVLGSAIHGSRHEDRDYSLLRTAPLDPISAGARVIHGVYTDADEYMVGLLPGSEAAGDNRGIDDSGSQGQGLDQ